MQDRFDGRNLTYICDSKKFFDAKFFQWNECIVKVIEFDDSFDTIFYKECREHKNMYETGLAFIPSMHYFVESNKDHIEAMLPQLGLKQAPESLWIVIMTVRPNNELPFFTVMESKCDVKAVCLKILYKLWVTLPFEYDRQDCNLDNFLLKRDDQTIYIYLVEFSNIRTIRYDKEKTVEKFENYLYADRNYQNTSKDKPWFHELLKWKRIDLTGDFTVHCKTSDAPRLAARSISAHAPRLASADKSDESVDAYEHRNTYQYMKDAFAGEGTKRVVDLYDCIHAPDKPRDKVQRKRCRTLQKLYGKKYFKYAHAWTWRGGRKRTRRSKFMARPPSNSRGRFS